MVFQKILILQWHFDLSYNAKFTSKFDKKKWKSQLDFLKFTLLSICACIRARARENPVSKKNYKKNRAKIAQFFTKKSFREILSVRAPICTRKVKAEQTSKDLLIISTFPCQISMWIPHYSSNWSVIRRSKNSLKYVKSGTFI